MIGMPKRELILVVILLFCIEGESLFSQGVVVDSLRYIAATTRDKKKRVAVYNKMAMELRHSDKSNANDMAVKAVSLALTEGDKNGQAEGLKIQGILNEDSGEFWDALYYYSKALELYLETGSKQDIAQLHSHIGSVCKTLGDYDKAIEHCRASLKLFEALDDKAGIAYLYRVLGSVYKYQGDYDKALHYYSGGYRLSEELGNRNGMASAYNNMGIIHLLMHDVEKAFEFYRKSLSINLADGNEYMASINYGNIGVAHLELGVMDSAMYYISKRRTLLIKMNDRKGMVASLEAFGDYYYKAGEYEEALNNYMQGLAQSQELGLLESRKDILKSLSSLYETRGDYNTSLAYYKAYVNLKDSILNQETLRRMEHAELEYAYHKEQQEILIQNQRRKVIRAVIYGTLLFSVLAFFLAFRFQNIKLKQKSLQKQAIKLEKQQLEAELVLKDKELFSKALYLAERNSLIHKIIERLEETQAEQWARASTINDILEDLRFSSNAQTWEEFEYIFLKVHPDFFNALVTQFPNLSPNERRLCAFLRLNLSTKDISNITHQSVHSLTVARTRLRKKLGIAHTGENLTSYLAQI